MRPQNLIALLLCVLAVFSYMASGQRANKRSILLTLPNSQNSRYFEKAIELVIFDENQLERSSFKTVLTSEEASETIKAILLALQTEFSVWPEGLELAAVFSLDGLNILDFSLEPHLALGVNDEWRLLRSISASLKRNGYENLKFLINHQESRRFLRFIELGSVLN